jgi:serine/threonine protein kinase
MRASDFIFGKIIVKNHLATEAAVRECLHALETGEDGGARSLADLMVARGHIAPDAAEKARHAAAKLQAERYLKFASELGFFPAHLAPQALEDFRAHGGEGSIGALLVGRGLLTPEQDAQVVARDPRTLDEGGTPPPPRAPLRPEGGEGRGEPSPEGAATREERSPPSPLPPGKEMGPAEKPPAPPPPLAPPPPPAPPPLAPPPPAPPPLTPTAGAPLRGAARELAAIAIRDGVVSMAEVEAALASAPREAREDPRAFIDALVAARVLARVHADQMEVCSSVEREAPEIAVEGYYLVEPLGFTAEGPVIRARRALPDGRTIDVALEVLTPQLAANQAKFEDFRKRTGALSVPEHPSLARTIDSGRAGDGYYLARELPPGIPLSVRIREQGPLPEKEAVKLAIDIGGALAAYSMPGLTHGSVRPENIVVAPDGRYILRDIGSTPSPEVQDPDRPPPCADLPRYLSPEQITGAPVDPRTDIYALGIVLFEAVTGKPPFDGETSAPVIAQHLGADLPDPAARGARISPRFHGLLKVMTAKDPAQRYANAEDLLEDLAGLHQGTMAIDTGDGPSDGGDDRTMLYAGQAHPGSDRTMISSQEDDLDLQEMRRAAAERRAKEAAAKARLPLLPGAESGPATPVTPGADPLVGRILSGRYRLLQKLGAGGMGSVYKAEHLLLHKTIALKILHPKLLENEESVRRFDREVKAASRFSHPGITQIFDAGEDAGPAGKLHYMVMEYVEGTDLEKIISREGALALPRVLALFKQVLMAVDEAHKKGIVHRDMKSDNIMVCTGADGAEIAKIMDFGIAKIVEGQDAATATALHNQQSFKTRKGVVTGTPQYMSPEQAAGDPNIDHRSDLYSLGVILYEMCLGELPFKSNTAMGYLGKHIVEPPIPFKVARPDIDLPKDLERIILKALEKTRDARYQTAGEMLQDLERTVFPAVLGAGAGTAGAGGTGGKGGRRAIAAVLSVVVLGGAAVGGWLGWRMLQSRRAAAFATAVHDAAEALGKSDLERARALLDALGADQDPAVKPLREQLRRLEAEKKKIEERSELIKKGEQAALEDNFPKASGYFVEAQKIRDDDAIREKIAWLAGRERMFEAQTLEKEADQDMAKGDFALAAEKLGRALEKAPSSRLEGKLVLARHKAELARAAEIADTPGRQREAAEHLREAVRVLGARDEFGEERKAAQKKLDELLESYKRSLTPTEAKEYADALVAEAGRREKDLDFRAARLCYRNAAIFADSQTAERLAGAIRAADGAAREQGLFELAMELARATAADPTAGPADRKHVAEALERYLAEYDRPEGAGHFVEKAKEELKKWN